jgi:hypothetical protein
MSYNLTDKDRMEIRWIRLTEGISNVVLTIGVIAIYVLWSELFWIFVDSIDGYIGSFFVAFELIFGFIALVIGIGRMHENYMHKYTDLFDTVAGVFFWTIIIYMWRCVLTCQPIFESFDYMVMYWLLLIGFVLGTLIVFVATFDYLEPDLYSTEKKYREEHPIEDE